MNDLPPVMQEMAELVVQQEKLRALYNYVKKLDTHEDNKRIWLKRIERGYKSITARLDVLNSYLINGVPYGTSH